MSGQEQYHYPRPWPNEDLETHEDRSKREYARFVLERREWLGWYAASMNLTIPQTRQHFTKVLCSLDPTLPASKLTPVRPHMGLLPPSQRAKDKARDKANTKDKDADERDNGRGEKRMRLRRERDSGRRRGTQEEKQAVVGVGGNVKVEGQGQGQGSGDNGSGRGGRRVSGRVRADDVVMEDVNTTADIPTDTLPEAMTRTLPSPRARDAPSTRANEMASLNAARMGQNVEGGLDNSYLDVEDDDDDDGMEEEGGVSLT